MDSGNGETIGPVQKFAAKVIDIALSSDGSLLAATLEDRTIAVSDVASGEVLRLFDVVSDTTGGGGLAFGANGELFATLGDGNNNNRKLWKRTVDPAKMIERLDARLRRLPELR
jgi:WD40 repeat protein